MCGIIGSVSNTRSLPDAHHLVGTLRHRGPDDQRSLSFGNGVFLGHCRLRIIDLTESGSQPMSNAGESVWIVYNGEIYNFLELRRELEAKGYCFTSRSDTEVIVHAYEELKEDCLSRLNGIFAFALYDRPRNRIILAR